MEVRVKDNSAIFKNAKDQAVAAALEAVGLTAERHAKENCPVDTGLLRNSITHAISGQPPAISEYKASFSEEKSKKGKRYSTRAKNADSLTFRSGKYSGNAPDDPKNKKAVYIGTNVVYAQRQEINDSYVHTTGQAHFLRDAAATHGDEYKRIMETQLRKAGTGGDVTI